MRKVLVASVSWLLLVGCAPLGCGEAEAPPPPRVACPPGSPSPALLIDGARVTYNGQPLPLPGTVEEWEAVLGPDWDRSSASNWVIWRNLGIAAIEGDSKDPQCLTSIHIAVSDDAPHVDHKSRVLQVDPHGWFAAQPFAGCVGLDGARLTASIGWKEFNAQKAGAQFQPHPIGFFERSWDNHKGKSLRENPPYQYWIGQADAPSALATCGKYPPERYVFEMDHGRHVPEQARVLSISAHIPEQAPGPDAGVGTR